MDTQPDREMTTDNDESKPADPRVDEITAEIDATRMDLTGTVREIGDRLEPANVAREARETIRDATMGKVEMMSIGAQETWRDVRTGNAGGIVDMVRENPVPAGMIGLGLAMLFLNRGSRSGAYSQYRYPYGRETGWHDGGGWDGSQARPMERMNAMGDRVGAMGDRVGDRMNAMGDRVSSMATDARESIGDTADRVSGSVGQMAEDLPQQAGAMIDTGASQARRMIDENPLGMGVVALAAGAVLGMLLPSTPFEREKVGPVRDQVVEQVGAAAEGAIDSAKSAAHRSDGSSGSQG